MRYAIPVALLALVPACAQAQGLPSANQVYAGPTSGPPATATFRALVPADVPTSSVLDTIGSTRGSVLERGTLGWQIITPGTSGLPWVSNGTGADPAYQALTNGGLATMAAKTLKGSVAGGTPTDLAAQQLATITNAIGCVNITSSAFGGAGDNTTDNTTPLTNALAALTGNGGCVYFPPGKYKFNSGVTFNFPAGIFSVALVGSGEDNTILTWPNVSGGLTFNYASINSSVHMRELALTTGATNGGNAVALALATSIANPAIFAQSDFLHITIRGDDGYQLTDYWSNAFNISNVSNINWNNIAVYGASTPNGTGISLIGLPASSTYAVQFNVQQSVMQALGTGILYGSFIQGVAIDETNFTATTNAIAAGSSETGTLAQLSVTNSQFNGGTVANANGILALTAINGVQIVNNLFLVPGTGGTAISLSQSKLTVIAGNIFWGQNAAASEQGVSITNTNSLPCAVNDNVFFGFNGTTSTGLNLGASSANCAVNGNTFLTNTIDVSDAGTGNTYWNNSGFDPAWSTFTPSPVCGTATFTVNSAKRKTIGKQTWIEVEITITAIGTCASTLTFTLPNSTNSSAALTGQETANATNVRDTVVCTATGATNGVACIKQGNHAYAANDHFIVSGVYENQ